MSFVVLLLGAAVAHAEPTWETWEELGTVSISCEPLGGGTWEVVELGAHALTLEHTASGTQVAFAGPDFTPESSLSSISIVDECDDDVLGVVDGDLHFASDSTALRDDFWDALTQ